MDQIYQTENWEDKFLIDIGDDGSGDPICIDTLNNCEIVASDHENNFSKRFMNTSVKELFVFLTLYKEFGEYLITTRGESSFLDSNFTDEEINFLKHKLRFVDNRALDDAETFWGIEIHTLIVNREHYKSK